MATSLLALTAFSQQAQDAADAPRTAWSVRNAIPARPTNQAAFAQLNALASQPFQSTTNRLGKIVAITGGKIASSTKGDAATRAAAFFAAHGEVFSLDPALTLVATPTASLDDRVAFTFEHSGRSVLGPRAFVRFGAEGSIESAALWNAPVATAFGTHALGTTLAAQRGEEALKVERARRGLDRAMRAPRTQEVFVAEGGVLRAAYRVVIASQEFAESWAVLVDGATGAELRIEDLVCRGTKGLMPIGFDGSFIHLKKFKIGNSAKGNVFKNQSDAILRLATPNTKLKNFGLQSVPEANSPKGFVFGARANVFDALGNDPSSAQLKFNFDPVLDAGDFDVANTYYQLEEFYQHVRKNLGVAKLASNFSIPIVVNFTSNEINAFFAADLYPDSVNPLTLGFMVFHDLSVGSGDVFDDLSRDPVVAGHEYTHAWLYYEFLDFDDPLDYPSRALNEAVADFYGSCPEEESIIGKYTGIEMLSTTEGLRDLQDDDQFPETTQNAKTLTITGLPEEHRNGEIFGAALVDIRDAIGVKNAQRLIFRALPGMPRNIDDAGISVFEVNNDSVGATDDFMGQCLLSILNETNTNSELEASIGAFTARGLLGGPVSVNDVIVNFESIDGKQLVYPSNLARTNSAHRYLFRAKQGRKLEVYLYADPAGSMLADFSIAASNADPNALTFTNPKQMSIDGKIVWQTAITLNLPLGKNPASTDPYYEITVNSTNTMTGDYALQVKVK